MGDEDLCADVYADVYAELFVRGLEVANTDLPGDGPISKYMLKEYRRWRVQEAPTGTDDLSHAAEVGLKRTLRTYYDEYVAQMRPDFQLFCKDHVRLRGVRANTIDGFISRSPMNTFAIIFTTGLMTFLNRMIKYDLAIATPALVTHCSRCDVVDLSADLLTAFKYEAIHNFRKNISAGALIILREKVRIGYTTSLAIQEKFVICHELGHLVSDFLLDGAMTRTLHESFGSQQHRSEYMADLLGFALLRRLPIFPLWAATFDQNTDDKIRLSSICTFFEMLALAFPDATTNHPSPHQRALNIIDVFFGRPFAMHYDAYRHGLVELDWDPLWEEGAEPREIARNCEDCICGESSERAD